MRQYNNPRNEVPLEEAENIAVEWEEALIDRIDAERQIGKYHQDTEREN